MRALAGIAAVALLFVVGAFVIAPTENTDFDQAQAEAEIQEVLGTFMSGFRELDMDKVMGTAHPELLAVPYGGRVLNWTEYRDALVAWTENKEAWKGDWTETNVRVLSPDLAVVSGIYVDTIQYSDGRHLHWPSNASVFLFERTPDGWKWSLGANSSPTGQPVGEG